MPLFKVLRQLAERPSVNAPPTEIYAVLIDDLYSALLSFAIGATTAAFVGAIAASRTGNAWLMGLTIVTAAVAAGRVVLTIGYRRHKEAIADDPGTLGRWERWYAIGASGYGACLGGMCFVAFAMTGDTLSHLLLNSYAAGFAAATAARNSSRPRIAIAQVSFVLLPIIIGSALRAEPIYAVLSTITSLYYLAVIEIVAYLGGNRLDLLLSTREKDKLAQSLAEQNLRFDAALANMSHGLCMFDAQLRLLVWNKRFCEIYRLPADALSPGMTMQQLVGLSAQRGNHPHRTVAEMTAEFEARLTGGVAGQLERPLPDGRVIALSHQPMADGGNVVIFEDITDRERAEARARFLATHDDLTGLPNRVAFGQAVSEAVKDSRRDGGAFAVMFVDLDRFKIINDTLGHAAGDSLLGEIAGRLRRCLRQSDIVARVGGDEFMILLREASDLRQVAAVARTILAALVTPLTIQGHECWVTASIGIACFPHDGQDEESLAKNADAAMYVAKEEGRNNFRFHNREMKTQSIERLMLETSLRRAIERNEFVLYYQPKRELGRGGISGVEALLRWDHPDLGLLPPSRFIPLAEETGLIVPIGKWVLETACAQNAGWQRQGLPAIRVAVNLSPLQFVDAHLLQDIRAALANSGLPPQLLELEITESMVMQNIDRAVRVLEAIKTLGITLAIDDFGTGYSSMSLVKKFPIHVLKIDRSFVRGIGSDSSDRAIAEAIIALGRALDLTIVAEGVETAEQEAFLRAHNCDEIQGYLISKPIPADEFAAFLAEHAVAGLKAHAAAAAAVSGRDLLQTGTDG